jgi:hypothetical protein
MNLHDGTLQRADIPATATATGKSTPGRRTLGKRIAPAAAVRRTPNDHQGGRPILKSIASQTAPRQTGRRT